MFIIKFVLTLLFGSFLLSTAEKANPTTNLFYSLSSRGFLFISPASVSKSRHFTSSTARMAKLYFRYGAGNEPYIWTLYLESTYFCFTLYISEVSSRKEEGTMESLFIFTFSCFIFYISDESSPSKPLSRLNSYSTWYQEWDNFQRLIRF